jgi:hypothetical protein
MELEKLVGKTELEKIKSIYETIMVNIPIEKRGEHIVDACSGNGLFGWYFLMHNPTCRVTAIDIRSTTKREKVDNYFRKSHPGLENQYAFVQADITIIPGRITPSLIVGVHACGLLTDRLMALASSRITPLVIVPCCYKKGRSYFDGTEGKNVREGIDTARLHHLKMHYQNVQMMSLHIASPMNTAFVAY